MNCFWCLSIGDSPTTCVKRPVPSDSATPTTPSSTGTTPVKVKTKMQKKKPAAETSNINKHVLHNLYIYRYRYVCVANG